MKRRKLDIIQQNTPSPRKFLVLRKLSFFFKTVLDFENPLVARFRTFQDINNRTHGDDEHQNPLIIELIHGPVNLKNVVTV
jgi:hypothetical protein